jgi:hypothetical protein
MMNWGGNMPLLHVSLTDEEFIDFAIMAREKGLKRSDLASVIIREAMQKNTKYERGQPVEFNAQGLPLAKRLKDSGIVEVGADGNPMVPQYERQ